MTAEAAHTPEDVARRQVLPSGKERIRLLYILGYGRSGTTVLDIALAQHPRIFGCGEVYALTRHVWDNNEYCACGEPVRECVFWSAVAKEWRYLDDPNRLGLYVKGQLRLESKLGLLFAVTGTTPNHQLEDFVTRTRALYQAIASVSGCSTLIDSSKLPARAFALARIPEIDLFLVHLVRDGRGVAWSLAKSYGRDLKAGLQKEVQSKPVARIAATWSVVNLASELLCAKVGPNRFIRVRYEDFVADPAATLEQIGRLAGIDFAGTGQALQQRNEMKPSHQVAGNRLRMAAGINIAVDDRWRTEMPEGKQAAVRLLSGPILRRYGYS